MNFSQTALSISLLIWTLPVMGQAGRPVLTPEPTPSAAAPTAPASPTAASATPAKPPIVGADYVIGPEDQLQVTVWENPALTGSVLVRPDGNISLPLIGDVIAAGLTPLQLAANITARIKDFVKDPTVNVAVLAVNSKQVIMIGEVGHVGPVPIRPGMTVLQAIVTAGGLTPFANKKKIYVLRGEPGKQQRIPFNYKKSLLNDDMLVQPGDRIVVPE
jgi:polysaccharide biosynthesis/export protein